MIKKNIIILILFWCFQIPALSQIQFGPKAGLTITKPSFDQFSGNTYKSGLQPGFQVGGMVFIPVTQQFGLQTELLFQRKGKSVYGQDLYEHKAYSNYLDLPILLNYTQGDRAFRWYLGAGGTISYWLGGGGKLTPVFGESVVKYDYDFGLNVPTANCYQIGLTLNAGTRFEIMDDRHIQLDFRFELGHTYMAEEREFMIDDFADNMLYSNRVASVSVAYLFTYFKKKQRLKSHTYDAKKRGN
ncbi:MAG: porin family protein [Cyclobacteriaceae bacterium]